MITQIVKMQVADFQKWRQMHDRLKQIQDRHGLNNSHITVDPTDSTKVTLILDWQDEDQMRQYSQSKEVAQVMHLSGLKAPPSIKVFKQI